MAIQTINYEQYFEFQGLGAIKFASTVLELPNTEEIYETFYRVLHQLNNNNYKTTVLVEYKNRGITFKKSNVLSTLSSKIRNLEKELRKEIKDSIHSKYRANITSKITIDEEFNALAFMRESVNKGFQLKQSLAQSSNESMAIALGYNPSSIKLTVSGYKSPLLAILEKNKHIKAVFVESVDRLSRNLSLTIDLLDYCSINKVKIYVGSNIMNRGVGRATLLLLSVFAEYELTAKQTSYSNDLLNVIKLELDLIEPSDMSDSELKLFNNLQFVERDSVFSKAGALAYKYKEMYENKTLNSAGKRRANNEDLYNNANEILKLLMD